jgi:predicted metalloprotease with PDZ domain
MFNALKSAFSAHYFNGIATLNRYLNLDDIDTYRSVILNQDILKIPYRIYNKPLTMNQINSFTHHQHLILSCVFTRHHNGFVRHEMVKNIMKKHPILKATK